ncbi:asparagine--tRNA ligase, chloroplastic/mitochondrial-like [Apium graveolens]|uniref:asparagine--tRNA ligase, chloroplastic/mitochondrial-like n=1 Tax=Apium graveolens TaxID=4045 RepID=UPI003D7A2628
MLQTELPMIREACLRVLVLCTIFLKEAAAFELCLADIGWNDFEMIWEPWNEDLFSRKGCFEADERDEVKVAAMVANGYIFFVYATAVFSPATSLRLNPFPVTVRFLSLRRTPPFLPSLSPPTTLLTKNPHFPPKKCTHYYVNSPFSGGRKLSSVIAAAFPSGEAAEKQKAQVLGSDKVGKFRKRLKIVDIKGGPDEGLDRLGQTLVVKGWVRTLRAQSSVTFIEVNDGSCLSNMQCVVGSDAEGYDQVENGLTTTGASICVEGILVNSQGSKQKVELKVEKLVTVGKSDPSFPIQKKRVSREFLRTKSHLRPRTNTFGAIGELIGGSQREERLDLLEDRLDNLQLNKDSYWWYLDLRRYGSVPHAGFRLGFERLVQFATGIENIRDAIPFPRTPGSA